MAVPALATGALSVCSIQDMRGYRVRQFSLAIPNLPKRLDGMTIAHVSDTHIGKFLHPDRLPAIADSINRLNADFIAFTGDLIDLALEDLPHGINFLRKLTPRCGLAICEGNHDLMQSRGDFEDLLLSNDLPLIVGNYLTLPRASGQGKSHPVQFLGLPWNFTDASTSEAVHFLKPLENPEAFPILLAHHPHAFDAAAAEQFPLTLAGHTHGGQIMLTDQFGAGSLRFRYTSGLYRKANSILIVNNGLGNWFPLRVHAPAEIVHLTLHST